MNQQELILSNNVNYHRFSIINALILIFSSAMPIFIASLFFQFFYSFFNSIILVIILPLLILFYYLLFNLNLLLTVKLLLVLLKLLHQPKAGIFPMKLKNLDYFFYCFRRSIKRLLFNVFNYFPLPWIRIFALKLCKIKTPNSVGLLDSYIDMEFIEFGEDSILGEGTMIMSSMIIDNKLLIKKVKLEAGCTVGAYSIVSPGTIIGKGTILGGRSYTQIGQILEPGWVYVGRPATKLQKQEIG